MASFLKGQVTDSVVVKYFPTKIQRSEILDTSVSEKEVKGKAHFKSKYTPQGELLNVEYIPGKKGRHKKLSGLKLYYGYWNPVKKELADGFTKDQLDGHNYNEVTFNRQGRIKDVTYFTKGKRKLWTYRLIWNRPGTRSRYKVEFHVREPLTLYNEFLFVDELSEMRPGWFAEFSDREDGRPESVSVYDQLGQFYYYYHFQYMTGGKKTPYSEIIVSEYFRDDSTKVGMHKLFYNKNNYLKKVQLFDQNEKLTTTKVYDYSKAPKELLLTTKNARDKLIEKRFIPFTNKYRKEEPPDHDKPGLADVLLFLEKTNEDDLNQLVQSIEEKFNIMVKMDTVVYKNIKEVDREIKKKEKELPVDKNTLDKKVTENEKIFTAGLNLNRGIIAGSYLDSGKVNTIGVELKLPYNLELFWFNIQGGFGVEYISFNSGNNTWGGWVFAETSDFIPFPYFPVVINGGLGKVGPGFGIQSGVHIGREIGPVKLAVRVNATVMNNIDGNNVLTGFLSGGLSVMYPFHFPSVKIPFKWW